MYGYQSGSLFLYPVTILIIYKLPCEGNLIIHLRSSKEQLTSVRGIVFDITRMCKHRGQKRNIKC